MYMTEDQFKEKIRRQKMLIRKYKAEQKKRKEEKMAESKIDILNLKKGIEMLKEEMKQTDFADQPVYFLDIFDSIFKTKMKEYLEKEKNNYFQSEDENNQNLFNFAKKRIREIENWVRVCFEAEKQIEQ